MRYPMLTVDVRYEDDVVIARQRAHQIAALAGYDAQDQTRVATAVSEIARNAFVYAGGGTVEFAVTGDGSPLLEVTVRDKGGGIPDLEAVLRGTYTSRTGMGMGILGTRRLMDAFDIDSSPAGTRITFGKRLPPGAWERISQDPSRLTRRLDLTPRTAYDAIREQNRELLETLNDLRARQEELVELNRELEDTNRGVVALYAEVEEKAASLKRANDVKSRFLSNMSHEFRTPLNSIRSLSQLLLERVDGPLTSEQERQIEFVKRSAEQLSELVDDLLDLTRAEAGRIAVRTTEFTAQDLFGTLRGMLRPLLLQSSVALVFEDPGELPPLTTDEGKVSQILRNFVSNALKFTEAGEIRVSAILDDADNVRFAVKDTGLGIAPEDHERVFEEFTQLDSPIQRRVHGTGLGLPLSRRLAELLGGRIELRSALGAGSTFTAVIPRIYVGAAERSDAEWQVPEIEPGRVGVLIVEDNPETALTYEKYLRGTPFQALRAPSLEAARRLLAKHKPVAIVLDVLLEGENTWDFLAELKTEEATRVIPIIVATVVDNRRKAMALGADAFVIKPLDRATLLGELERLTATERQEIVVIDDDDVSRYLLRGYTATLPYRLVECDTGEEGLRLVRERRPAAVFLDLGLPDMDGLDVLAGIRADPITRAIPVVVYTSRPFSPSERASLEESGAIVLGKDATSRDAGVRAVRRSLERLGVLPGGVPA